MPGTAANPVVLDPFRTLVEVGWSKVPEYIRISVPIEMIGEAGGLITCSADPIPFPYTGASSLTETYLISSTVDNHLEAEKPYSLEATGYWRNKEEELTVDGGEHPVTITAVPEGPFIQEEPDAWSYTWAGLSGSSGHATRITAQAGEAFSDPDYPGLPTDLFEATAQDLELVAHEITASPACGYEDPGPPPTNFRPRQAAPDTGTGANPDLDVFFAAAFTLGSATLNFASLGVSYRDETYSPVAISGSEENDYLFVDGTYAIDILCKRNSSTA
jgi:hypothetical protein